MFDRTTLDLRIAEHGAVTESINQREWQRQGEPQPRHVRAALAAALVALAVRLDPALASQHREPAAPLVSVSGI